MVYACRKPGYHSIQMHREILNPPPNMKVDHIDGNGLNNQKSNLRIVTNRQNQQNRHHKRTSKYPGVSWAGNIGKWRTQIQLNGKRYYLGSFDLEVDAATVYKVACAEIGEQP